MSGLTIPQLAEKMGISRIAVYNKVKSGKIPAQKIGRNYIIKEEDADKILSEIPSNDNVVWIDSTVKTIVSEYGPLFKWLSQE